MDEDKDANTILVQEFQTLQINDVEFINKCAMLALDIQGGSFSLLQLVEQLKGLLISSLPASREKGMIVLSQILEMLPNDFLSSEQLNFICVFYSDRLNDHHQVIPAVLRGILVLMDYKNLPDDVAKQILSSLFQNVPCQQQQQSDRLIIYKILKTSLDNRLTEILQMSFDFVYGVISAMDGERDPRNLLYLFNWLPKYLKAVTLDHLSEEMFEVMACYYPVDFRSPSQDPDHISRESLAASLCKCLCAVPEFAEFCLPLALEKLASALRIAKLDSLNLIIESCKTFETSAYIQHSADIWSQIQREVIQCTDQELEDLALTTLETVLNKLSKSSDDIYKGILSDIIDTLKGNLLPNLKLFMPSVKILHHTAKSSTSATNYVISQIVPLLVNTCNMTTTPAHQVLIFKSLIDLVKAYIDIHKTHDIIEVKELTSIPNLCIKAILQENDEVKAIGLFSIATLSRSLPLDIRKRLYEYLRIYLVTPQSKIVRTAALECFKTIAWTFNTEVHENILNNIEVKDNENLRLYLDSLTVIADNPDFTDIVLSTISDYCLKDLEVVEIATGTLRRLLIIHENNMEIHQFLVIKRNIIYQLLEWLKSYLNIIDTSKHKSLLENLSEILKIVIGYQPSNVQHTIISTTLENVFALYESTRNLAIIIILDGLVTRLRKDVNVDQEFTELLLDCCITFKDEYVRQVALQLLANIINKDENEQRLQNRLHKISSVCNDNLLQENNNTTLNVINLMSWVTKALIMRSHVECNIWTTKLLELLDSKAEVAKGFKIIMSDNYACLSAISFSNKRLLYQQKFFVDVSNMLSEKYNGENGNYLLAMGYLLQEAPKQVFVLHFNKILRLVIMCLEHCEDADVLCAMLETLCDLIKSKESLMEQHLQEFLPRFLKLANVGVHMQVRIDALQCIQNYAIGFPLYKLLLHKQDVLLSLEQCLDDKKRLVRKEAVEARNRWFMVDAPI